MIPANRIFDTLLYNHFLSLDEMGSSDMYKASLQDKNLFIREGRRIVYDKRDCRAHHLPR